MPADLLLSRRFSDSSVQPVTQKESNINFETESVGTDEMCDFVNKVSLEVNGAKAKTTKETNLTINLDDEDNSDPGRYIGIYTFFFINLASDNTTISESDSSIKTVRQTLYKGTVNPNARADTSSSNFSRSTNVGTDTVRLCEAESSTSFNCKLAHKIYRVADSN